MTSAEEIKPLKKRDRLVFASVDAPKEMVEAVRNSKTDP
jgi:hypothetical protein